MVVDPSKANYWIDGSFYSDSKTLVWWGEFGSGQFVFFLTC